MFILKNVFFWISASLVVTQQVCVSLSTYFIGKAAYVLSSGSDEIFSFINIFFLCLGLAYVLGSLSLIFRTKLSNSGWRVYVETTFERLREKNGDYNTKKNKDNSYAWLGSESLETLNDAGYFFVDIIGVYCNVLFNWLALWVLLGLRLVLVMFMALILSLVLLVLFRKKIRRTASDIQSNQLSLLRRLSFMWDTLFSGPPSYYADSLGRLSQKMKPFFSHKEMYALYEQIISSAPILISLPLMLGLVLHSGYSHGELGALLVSLPRTLHLFQSMHAATTYSSQLILKTQKVKNLSSFLETLENVPLDHLIHRDKIGVYDVGNGKSSALESLVDIVKNADIGRWCITGDNGVGKSSFLKQIKGRCPHAILITPHTDFGVFEEASSTGQGKIRDLRLAFKSQARVFLLDEWDANLDEKNVRELDALIQKVSREFCVVEVRHKG